jgi:hypothetical protein
MTMWEEAGRSRKVYHAALRLGTYHTICTATSKFVLCIPMRSTGSFRQGRPVIALGAREAATSLDNDQAEVSNPVSTPSCSSESDSNLRSAAHTCKMRIGYWKSICLQGMENIGGSHAVWLKLPSAYRQSSLSPATVQTVGRIFLGET